MVEKVIRQDSSQWKSRGEACQMGGEGTRAVELTSGPETLARPLGEPPKGSSVMSRG